MSIDQFIRNNQIQPGDAIVVRKESFGMLDHYVIYLGIGSDVKHKFIANYPPGVRILPDADIQRFLDSYAPVKINRFQGSSQERREAVGRALSRQDEQSYHLILNNCEHFANWVQTREAKSEQADNFVGGLALAGLIGLMLLAFSED